jgi:hypothetical protein
MGRGSESQTLETRRRALLIVAVVAVTFASVAIGASSASAVPPKVASTFFSHVTTNTVELEAKVNPEGKVVVYHFEYGPADCSSSPCTTGPLLEGTLTSKATTAIAVAPAILEGLAPATIYHFRIVVSNAQKETVEGPDTTFRTYALPSAFGACSNDTFRGSFFLPDCRAYEQASSPDKNGADVNGGANQVEASSDGSSVDFFSAAGLPGAVGAQEFETYLARRDTDSWSTGGVYPPASDGSVARNAGWTPDLSLFFSNVADSFFGPWTFRARSSAERSFTPLVSGAEKEGFLAGASADGSIVYFQSEGQQPPSAASKENNLYVWDRDSGKVSLAGVLPNAACVSPPCIAPGGSFAGPYEWFSADKEGVLRGSHEYYVQNQHAISNDGTRAYFTASGGQLYLREGATGSAPTTVQVSASEKTNGGGTEGTDTNGTRPAAFMSATPDGSKAFFTSPEKLTSEATTGPEASDPPTIASASIDGTETKLNSIPARAHGLTVSGSYLYWANPTGGTIGRARLGASGPEEIKESFITGASNPQAVAIGGEYIYWTNAAGEEEDEGSIGRAKLGPGGAEEVRQDFFATSFTHLVEVSPSNTTEITLFNPRGIAVDETHIYWGDVGLNGNPGSSSALIRSNLKGEEVEEYGEFENQPGEYLPFHIAPQGLAIEGNFIYVSTHGKNDATSNLRRLSLLDPRAPALFASEEGVIDGLATDSTHFYWANTTTNSIGRANLEFGEEVKADFIKEAARPKGLAVTASHFYWSANQEAPSNLGNDLYRFDAGANPGERLTDLTVDSGDPNGAEVKGILGASNDGEDVYYAANGVPDGTTNSPNGQGESATLGNCHGKGDLNSLLFSGECNLYLHHGTQTIFIARLNAAGGKLSDAANWEPVGTTIDAPENTARVSADGQTLLFRSRRQLGAYDNRGEPQLYRYQLGAGSAVCISCSPSGEAPVGEPTLQSIKPALRAVEPPGAIGILTRNLSADGNRIFFETPDKLVAEDTDGEAGCPRGGQAFVPACQDVYEWEAKGTGSCESSDENGGCLYLLSSGASAEPAFFADASESGNDAFIFTRDALVPQDRDQLQDVYDARVEGGLVSQNVVSTPICEGDACKGSASSPHVFQSRGFSGPPNPKAKACPKGKRKVTRKGKSRCVSKKHHKSKARKSKRANAKERASR